MKIWRISALMLASVVCGGYASSALAATVTGTVTNGTTNRPAAGVDVLLIQLQGSMETVASTKADAAGRYRIENDSIGQGPMLIRAVYRGVNFHQPLPPGVLVADVTIYEPTTDPRGVRFPSRIIFFQPTNDLLMVGEEYLVQNDVRPAATYYKQDGNFEFRLPTGAELRDVTTTGPAGMPVTQGTIDKGEGRYAISYAFQPGESRVQLSYAIPYPNNQAKFRLTSLIDSPRIVSVVPPTMEFIATGFNPAGQEQGYNLFERETVRAGVSMDFSISGTAPPPSEVSRTDQTSGRASGVVLQSLPARLDSLKWIVITGLAAIFALGLAILFRQQGLATATAPGSSAKAMPNRKGRRHSQAKATDQEGELAGKVSKEVTTNLDSLKDTLLRIELRRQAGTISEEEYTRERNRTQQMLRELVDR